ncbi:D-mandelate dehydrogenase-like protein [Sporormia fimetaria CBS 119925]|uniref:D-mandelate dehydrogenase-like protein n=1 Tax=Sporormia fimetaria CBS 119925 TaxID=1340428 RepID=A0A6A6VCL9_9PLEO|nr:D-mandelate dehydrogenase-like protein [Sporormia fimetaria CBS 119925]
MSLATPKPEDPPPKTSPSPTTQHITNPSNSPNKPTILHLGDDIRWNHELYAELRSKFHIERSYSMNREEFKAALEDKRWGDFVGMYRPFWNTGGEMGNWDEELISLLPKSCEIYASAGAGFDWVDTKTMADYGIIYCNSAPACTESVADAALVLILSTFRGIPWSFLAARSCSPSRFADANQNIAAVTHNPNGHLLGIIGLGKIGTRVAEKAALACEMQIAYHDLARLPEREDALRKKGIEALWCETLEELLREADVVVLATPFSGQILLGHREFAQFKNGARLVNVARGKLVDEDALVEALESGRLSAAGLDVHANEPYVDPRLAKRENVMVLSHTAGASVESHVGFERLGMENLLGWFGEGKVLTAVNLEEVRGRRERRERR